MGDVSFRVGFQLSKSVGKRPAEIAEEIEKAVLSSLASSTENLVSSVEANPRGFLNFRLNAGKLFTRTLIDSANPSYGQIDLGKVIRLHGVNAPAFQ